MRRLTYFAILGACAILIALLLLTDRPAEPSYWQWYCPSEQVARPPLGVRLQQVVTQEYGLHSEVIYDPSTGNYVIEAKP